jgi:hypothetical protein
MPWSSRQVVAGFRGTDPVNFAVTEIEPVVHPTLCQYELQGLQEFSGRSRI